MKINNMLYMKFITANPSLANFSLKKEHSDFSINQIILNALIGTLVKYDTSGRVEPYLAESWTVSNDHLVWNFSLRNGLTCENGEIINAESFRLQLIKQLSLYAQRGSVISFDALVGWESFIQFGDSQGLGITAKHNNQLEFTFSQNPEDFLELLRMPYFGYWCDANSEQFISSGSYLLDSYASNSVRIRLRDNWFSNNANSPKEVNFRFGDFHDIEPELNTISKLSYSIDSLENYTDSYLVLSPPTWFEGFVLSPFKKGLFNDPKNREVFRDRILSLAEKYNISKSFYLTKPLQKDPLKNKELFSLEHIDGPITFALERDNYSSEELNHLTQLLNDIFSIQKIEFEIVKKGTDADEFYKKTDSNSFFDARIALVDIGTKIQNFAIKMMFCTKLGISFPDHQQKIEKLVTKTFLNNLTTDETYANEFNEILYSEAVVIPYKHHSEKWLVSNSIDPESVAAMILHPRFEKIRFKQ